MKYFDIPKLYGIVKDFPPRMIPIDKLSGGDNIIFKNGIFERRAGYLAFGEGQPLGLTGGSGSGKAVTNIIQFEQLTLERRFLIATTIEDTYRYNFNSATWEFITRNYATGTVSGAHNTKKTITFTGSNFDTNLDGVMYIKFGDTDMNSSGTWYTVDSVDTTTKLILTENITLSGGEEFVMRICWNGTVDDYHSSTQPYDDDELDKILVITNGIDANQKFVGSGSMILLGYIEASADTTNGSPVLDVTDHKNISTGMLVSGTGIQNPSYVMSISASTDEVTINNDATATGTVDLVFDAQTPPAKYVGYFGSVGYEHTVLANVYESGYKEEQKILTSIAGDPEDFFNGSNYQLYNVNSEIVGLALLKSRLICYKKSTITEIWAVPDGTNSDPYDMTQDKINGIGTPSIRTVVNYGDFHIFLGEETSGINVYFFDGLSVQAVGSDIIQHITDSVSMKNLTRAFALPIKSRNLYCLFMPLSTSDTNLPDVCYAFNYVDKTWTIWNLNDKMTAVGDFSKGDSLQTWADMVTDTTGTVVNGSPVVTVPSTTGMSATMRFDILDGAGDVSQTSYIASVDSTTQITLDDNITDASDTYDVRWGHTWETISQTIRWRDLIAYDNNIDVSYLLGNENGYIYEFAEAYANDNGVDIDCDATTSDFPLNDKEHTFKLLKAVVGMQDSEGETIRVRASVDFGENWSDWVIISIDATSPAVYIEGIVNFMQRGKQVRFQFQNIDGGQINIESVVVGYNDMGIKL